MAHSNDGAADNAEREDRHDWRRMHTEVEPEPVTEFVDSKEDEQLCEAFHLLAQEWKLKQYG